MSDNKDKKKRVENFTPEEVAAISEKNLAGKGWSAADFGFGSQVTPQNINPLGVVPPGVNARFSTPEDQAKVRQVLSNNTQAAAAQGPNAASPSFFAKLFDTSDTWTPTGFKYEGNPIESVWDSAWAGLGWVNDRINQGAVWSQSVAPGGLPTMTWDQAGQVSIGQAAITNNAQLGRQINEQVGNDVVGNIVSGAAQAALGMLNPLGMAGTSNVQEPFAAADFNILDPEQRKQAFEESTYGKVASGITDAVFSVVADPTIIAGKAASIAKLKYLDDTFRGTDGLARLRQQFVDSAGKEFSQKAPIAQFADLTAQVDANTGKKVLSHREIARRIAGATNQETIASALYHNTDETTAQLILRYAFNDIDAGKALVDRRPAIGLAIMQKQRQRMTDILVRDPSKKSLLADYALAAEKRLDDKLKSVEKGSQDYARLLDARNRAQETYAAIVDDRLHELTVGASSNPEITALLAREQKDLVAHDRALSKFLDDETQRVSQSSNAFKGSTKGFARDTALGRAVEQSRMRRVTAGARAEMTRGAVTGTGRMVTLDNGVQVEKMDAVGGRFGQKFWESDIFGDNGFTRGLRVWRWFGEENPQGFIVTKGAGALGSWKAVKAALDDVDIYSGAARTVILQDGTKILVGGADRKEKLLGLYMDAVHDSTKGSEAAQVALAKVEDAMFNDIAAWHGIRRDLAEELKNKAMTEKQGVLSGLRNKDVGFWIDENGVPNRAPWLESQIQNGTYMLNFRALNRLARLYDETGVIKTLDSMSQFIGKNAKYAYDLFNEMWRPAVLLRLGYTQRNVAEGMFRAAAYTFSIDPLRYALIQGKNVVRNTAVKWALRPAANKAEAAARLRAAGDASVKMPPTYTRWLSKQIDATDRRISELEQSIIQPGALIEDTSSEARDFMVDYYKSIEARYSKKYDAAVALNASKEELAQLSEVVQHARDTVSQLSDIKVFTGETPESIASLSHMRLAAQNLEYTVSQRAALDSDLSAAAMFRAQGESKARMMSGTFVAPDGTVLSQAFDQSNPALPVILSNLSADATTKSMSIAASDSLENAFTAYRKKYYVSVTPGDKNYFDGVASTLRQIKYSEIGSMAINGKSADEIADFLYKTKERHFWSFLFMGRIELSARVENRLPMRFFP